MYLKSVVVSNRNFLITLQFLGLLIICQTASAQESIVPYNSVPLLPTIWKSEPPAGCPFVPSTEIAGVAFTRQYVSYTDADTFYPSLASDDNMYCGWIDGEIGLESCQSGGEEREKLVDVYMEDFKQIFGFYPKSVGSWLDYLLPEKG